MTTTTTTTTNTPPQPREWRLAAPPPAPAPAATSQDPPAPAAEHHYLASTSLARLDRAFVNRALASDEMPWARALSPSELETMLARSLNLGLYLVRPSTTTTTGAEQQQEEQEEQIGFARLVTDGVTTAYLTDVYCAPGWRGRGLGRWMMGCVRAEVEAMTALRRGMLMATSEAGRRFYARELGYWDLKDEGGGMSLMTRRYWELPEEEKEGGGGH